MPFCFLSVRYRPKRKVQFPNVGCYWEAVYHRDKPDTSAKLQVRDPQQSFGWLACFFTINRGDEDDDKKQYERGDCMKDGPKVWDNIENVHPTVNWSLRWPKGK